VTVARSAVALLCDRRPFSVRTPDGVSLAARSVIIATGARYRRLALDRLEQFEGAGVYYGATPMEARLCAGEVAVIVGGGNSAGQAAIYLAQTASHVYIAVRGSRLDDSMSRYLIRRIESHPRVTLLTRTELVALHGERHLEGVTWRDRDTGSVKACDTRHLFVMTGAAPNTTWLEGCLALDARGFIKTGPDLNDADLATARWPLARRPLLLESSRPGVFAVGDVRAGSLKRVAAAVGEGSTVVALVHQILREGGAV
jgi:thioredoxin reductase (NADPH)